MKTIQNSTYSGPPMHKNSWVCFGSIAIYLFWLFLLLIGLKNLYFAGNTKSEMLFCNSYACEGLVTENNMADTKSVTCSRAAEKNHSEDHGHPVSKIW